MSYYLNPEIIINGISNVSGKYFIALFNNDILVGQTTSFENPFSVYKINDKAVGFIISNKSENNKIITIKNVNKIALYKTASTSEYAEISNATVVFYTTINEIIVNTTSKKFTLNDIKIKIGG